MGLYNFQRRFVPMVLAGEKTHTIRASRKHVDKPGNTLHLYTGLRQKGARLLMRAECTKVEEVEISGGWESYSGEFFGDVKIDGSSLYHDEREQLARRDGFDSFAEMMEFWRGRLPFQGHIIHWKKNDPPV